MLSLLNINKLYILNQFYGVIMNFIRGTLALSLSCVLVACGGGGGYYGNDSSTEGPTTTPEVSNEAKETLIKLKKEGQYLFGNYDPEDATAAKGYIDHALDTFAQGPLQLAVDTKKLFEKDKSDFIYHSECFGAEGNQIYENTACYILSGEKNIKRALNKISPNTYANWNFKVTKEQLASLKITPDQIEKFTGESFLIIFDNQNKDKAFNDIWVAGVFSYPYKQSWGLSQTEQLRIVSMNGDGQYQITATDPITSESKTYGALKKKKKHPKKAAD